MPCNKNKAVENLFALEKFVRTSADIRTYSRGQVDK